MFGFFDFIAKFLGDIAELIMSAVVWAITKLFILVLPMLEWLFDMLISVIVTLINSSNALSQFGTAWSGLPDELLYIATILQVPAAASIILSAYVIRITIKLIPGI